MLFSYTYIYILYFLDVTTFRGQGRNTKIFSFVFFFFFPNENFKICFRVYRPLRGKNQIVTLFQKQLKWDNNTKQKAVEKDILLQLFCMQKNLCRTTEKLHPIALISEILFSVTARPELQNVNLQLFSCTVVYKNNPSC